MTVRFMTETFGVSSPFTLLQEIATGADLPAALQTTMKLTYEDFELKFVNWLSSWDDPERTSTDVYFQSLNHLINEEQEMIYDQRVVWLNSAQIDRYGTYEKWVWAAEKIVKELTNITPPESHEDIHYNAAVYFDLLVRWLTLNKSNSSSAANDLIPELNARKNLLGSSLANIKIVNNLK